MATNYESVDGNLYQSPFSFPGGPPNAENIVSDYVTNYMLVGKTMGPSVMIQGCGAGDSVQIQVLNTGADVYNQTIASSAVALNDLPGVPHPQLGNVTSDVLLPIGPCTYVRAVINNASGNCLTVAVHSQKPK